MHEYMEEVLFWRKSYYQIEQQILESFWKWELRQLINETEKSYYNERSPYLRELWNIKRSQEYLEASEMDKIFIEQIHYYFNWWEELDKTFEFIVRLENYYKLYHQVNESSKYRKIDYMSIPIQDIIGKYVPLPSNLKKNILCPIHKEKTPSFRINTDKNLYYCFGCHSWWNVLNFISSIEWITTKDALKKLLFITNIR